MPGLRPNPPAPDVPSTSRLFALDTTPEHEMNLADDLETQGEMSLRVDCNCNAYSKETVSVPFVVIADALKGVEEGDDGRSVSARAMADERIVAFRTGDPTPKRPSGDFNVTHLAQVAATMRIRKLIPFSPFSANAWHLKQSRAVYTEWVEQWDAQAAPGDDLDVLVDWAAGGGSVPHPDGPAPHRLAHLDVRHELAPEPGDPGAQVADVGAGYPDPPHAKPIIEWVGDDYARAVYAWELEVARVEGSRKSVREHVAELGVDIGE